MAGRATVTEYDREYVEATAESALRREVASNRELPSGPWVAHESDGDRRVVFVYAPDGARGFTSKVTVERPHDGWGVSSIAQC